MKFYRGYTSLDFEAGGLNIVGSTAQVTLELCTFSGCKIATGKRGGGAISIGDGHLSAYGTIFSYNEATTGGADVFKRTSGSITINEVCPKGFVGNAIKGEPLSISGLVGGEHFSFRCTSICAAGKYSSSPGSMECTPCARGSYLEDNATSALLHDEEDDCSTCTTGRYTNRTATVSCETCPPGMSTEDKGLHTELHDEIFDCKNCPAGNKGVEGICEPCTAGTFSGPGSTACLSCPPGKALISDTASSESEGCESCPPGFYSGMEPNCHACPSGTFCVEPKTGVYEEACQKCVAGAVSDEGAVDCEICSSGKFSNLGQASPCTNCPGGKFITDDAVDESKHSGSASCLLCDPGRYSPGGAGICQVCSSGTYTADQGKATWCEPCSKGTYISDDGFDVSEHDSPLDCKPCPASFFASSPGSASCKSCGEGKNATLSSGSATCTACDPGKYDSLAAWAIHIALPDEDEPEKAGGVREVSAYDKNGAQLIPTGAYVSGTVPSATLLCIDGKDSTICEPEPGPVKRASQRWLRVEVSIVDRISKAAHALPTSSDTFFAFLIC